MLLRLLGVWRYKQVGALIGSGSRFGGKLNERGGGGFRTGRVRFREGVGEGGEDRGGGVWTGEGGGEGCEYGICTRCNM